MSRSQGAGAGPGKTDTMFGHQELIRKLPVMIPIFWVTAAAIDSMLMLFTLGYGARNLDKAS